jgi:ligand-binding sensor domain-containing protein
LHLFEKNLMLKTLPAHILQLLLPFCAAAQKATFEFFTTADGLSGNNTTSVTQDDQGFLWLVNDGKIHRYDGRSFVVYPIPSELSTGQEHLAGLASWQDSLLFVWSEHFTFLFNLKTGNWQPIELKDKDIQNDGTRFWLGPGQDQVVMTRIYLTPPSFQHD